MAKRPNVGVEVILDGHRLDASEIVQDDDAGHVHLGKEPTVVWMGRRYMVMDKAVTVRDTGSVDPGSRAFFGSGSGSSNLF